MTIDRILWLKVKTMKTEHQHASNVARPYDNLPLDRQSEAFPTQTEPSIGMEVELPLEDADTGQPLPLFDDVWSVLPGRLQERTQPEYNRFQIEHATSPSPSLHHHRDELNDFHSELTRAAGLFGARPRWSGLHPTWIYDPAMVTRNPRAQMLSERFGPLARQMAACSLHIHAAVPRDKAVQVLDGIQQFIPLVAALSTNSPIHEGEVTGRRSQRLAMWANSFPVCGLCGPFGDWAGYHRHLAELQDAGLITSQKDLYWCTRLTRYGTIEVRVADLPPSVDHCIALGALVQALVVRLQEDNFAVAVNREVSKADLHSAIMHGPNATLTDHRGDRVSPMEFLTRLCSDLEGVARQLGSLSFLEMAPSVLANNGSTQQLKEWEASQATVARRRAKRELESRRQWWTTAGVTAASVANIAAFIVRDGFPYA